MASRSAARFPALSPVWAGGDFLVGVELRQSARVVAVALYHPLSGRAYAMRLGGFQPGRGIAFANFLAGAHDISAIVRRGAIAGFGPGVPCSSAGGTGFRCVAQSQQMSHFMDVGSLMINLATVGSNVELDISIIIIGGIRPEK